jgi:hypothetical protein
MWIDLLNFDDRTGRGFNRGRSAPRRAGFHGGRGFNNHSLGRGGRFSSAPNNNSFEVSPSDFRGSQAPAFRGALSIAIQSIILLFKPFERIFTLLTIINRG